MILEDGCYAILLMSLKLMKEIEVPHFDFGTICRFAGQFPDTLKPSSLIPRDEASIHDKVLLQSKGYAYDITEYIYPQKNT